MPAGPLAPRAPGSDLGRGRVGRPVAPTPPPCARAVSIAVPDGASTFWSWWSSMISAVSNHGAASSANRIISTAPMAKFGAMRQLLLVNVLRKASRSASVKPVVPTTAWMPCSAAKARFSREASSTVKSTTTSAPASTSASARRRDVEVAVDLGGHAQVEAGVLRVDGRDQLELGVGDHRLAHRATHAPGRAEHPDPDHAAGGLRRGRRDVARSRRRRRRHRVARRRRDGRGQWGGRRGRRQRRGRFGGRRRARRRGRFGRGRRARRGRRFGRGRRARRGRRFGRGRRARRGRRFGRGRREAAAAAR